MRNGLGVHSAAPNGPDEGIREPAAVSIPVPGTAVSSLAPDHQALLGHIKICQIALTCTKRIQLLTFVFVAG